MSTYAGNAKTAEKVNALNKSDGFLYKEDEKMMILIIQQETPALLTILLIHFISIRRSNPTQIHSNILLLD